VTRAVPSPCSKGIRGRPASEVEAVGDTAVAENRPDPGSHVRTKIYEIGRYHPAQGGQPAEDRPDDDASVPSQAPQQKKILPMLDIPHNGRIYFFQQ
jgi:hypothetical protein